MAINGFGGACGMNDKEEITEVVAKRLMQLDGQPLPDASSRCCSECRAHSEESIAYYRMEACEILQDIWGLIGNAE